MADFMYDHIVDATGGSMHKFRIQSDTTSRPGAPPPFGHPPDLKYRFRQMMFLTPGFPRLHSAGKLVLRPFSEPFRQKLLDRFRLLVRSYDFKIRSLETDACCRSMTYFEAILPPEIPMCRAGNISTWRGLHVHFAEVPALGSDPARTFHHFCQNRVRRGILWSGQFQ